MSKLDLKLNFGVCMNLASFISLWTLLSMLSNIMQWTITCEKSIVSISCLGAAHVSVNGGVLAVATLTFNVD